MKKIFEKILKKVLTNEENYVIILYVVENNIAGLCKGSTNDSDSFCSGSNPDPAAISQLKG